MLQKQLLRASCIVFQVTVSSNLDSIHRYIERNAYSSMDLSEEVQSVTSVTD